MTGPSNAAPQQEKKPVAPVVRQRSTLVENMPLKDPAYAQGITDDTVMVLSRWLKDLIGVEVKARTLKTLLAALPVTGSVFSAFDVVDDIRTLATYDNNLRKWGYQQTLPWVETGLDIIGIVPLPPFKAASMGLKSAIKMAFDPKYVFNMAKDQASSMMIGSAVVMLEEIGNTHLKTWEPKLIDTFGQVIDGTIKTVDSVARLPQARAISAVYTTFTRKKDPAEEIKDLLNDIGKTGKDQIKEVAATLAPLILAFVKQHKSIHVSVPKSEIAKIKTKTERESRPMTRPASTQQENKHLRLQTPAVTTKARTAGKQNGTAGPECRSCKTPNPVNLATGEEILYQTDFAAPGIVPVAWTRCYRSSHEPYDHGLLGARWTSAYITAITQDAHGLVYHDPTGRNVKFPPLAIGESHDSISEALTLTRTSATEFAIIYRSGDCDVFRTDGNPLRDAHGSIAMRYALRARQSMAGPALYVLPLHEARRQFALHPAVAQLSADALLIVTDGHQLWLECRPADADAFSAASPAMKQASSDLAALHDANQKAGIALVNDDAALQPAAYLAQLRRCIGRVDQLLTDGSRHTHVRYRYAPSRDEHGILRGANAGLDLVEQTDAQDNTRSYAYAAHLLTRYTDYNGFGQNLTWKHELTWAPFPVRCIRTVADDGSEDTRLSYDTWFNETTLIDAAGNKTVYTYNRDNLVTGIATTAADGSQPFQQRVWDDNGNLIKDIDPEGRTTLYRYDSKGRLLSVTDPAGATTRYDYDAAGNPITITDPAGREWKRAFDSKGHLISQADPAGNPTAYTYNDLGQLVAIKDAKGGTKMLAYNEAGQLVSHTDCSNKTSRFSYNRLGHLIAAVDAASNITRYDTDGLGRVIAAIRPDGSREHYHYDANDNLTAVTDANGKITRFGYTPQGQLHTRIDANGNSLAYQYDAHLQLRKLINQNGERYDFAYDAQGRLTEETGFDGKRTSYQYNLAGDLVASHSGKLHTEYDRDDTGRLLAKHIHQVTGRGPVTHTTRYQYDALGNLLWAHSRDSDITFAYSDAGHLIEETQHVRLRQGGRTIERVFTFRHEVDALGNRIETTLPNGRKVGTQRYGSGHWIGTLWNGNPIVDLERDDLHREKVRQLGRHRQRLTQTRSYDPLSRLSSLKLTGTNHELLAARAHSYDAAGNLVRIQDQQRGTLAYDYDPVGQLLKATQPNLIETFQFDPAGNLTDGTSQKTTKANTAGIDHKSWEEGLDRLTEQPVHATRPKIAPVTHNLLKSYLNAEFDHDAEGNTIRKIVKGGKDEQPYSLTLHYDAENRLIKAVRPGAGQTIEAGYVYDAFSRRIAKVVRTLREAQATGTYGGTGRMETVQEDITFFAWDGDTLIQEIQPDKTITYLYEPDSFVPLAQVHSDTPDSAYDPAEVAKKQVQEEAKQQQEETEAENLKWLKVTDAKAHALAVKAIEERKKREEQEAFERLEEEAQEDRIYYINTDHLGTPQEVVSEDGKVVWLAKYRAWGRVHALDREEVRQPLRFQGQYEDEETGLHYNRFRYFDPDAGRYISKDPVGLAGGENLYKYNSNPINWIDPFGLAPCSPKINSKHIFHGETNRRGRPTGFHHQGSIGHGDNAIMTQRGPSNAQGVYQANVGVLNPATGIYQTKTSTMFPDSWSRAKTLDEIRSAYQDALNKGAVNGKKFKGISCGGVEIEGYLDNTGDINTAYPKM